MTDARANIFAIRRPTMSLQPTCYPCDYSTVNEDGKLFDSSSRHVSLARG